MKWLDDAIEARNSMVKLDFIFTNDYLECVALNSPAHHTINISKQINSNNKHKGEDRKKNMTALI